MFGEAVTSCHMRVPVSSRPKYCSVSRFSKTASWSRSRTSTCVGAAARSLNVTIRTTPLQTLAARFAARPQFLVRRVFYRGLPRFATDSRNRNRGSLPPTAFSLIRKQKAGPDLREPAGRGGNRSLGLFLLHVDLEVDSRRHLLQLFEPGFRLLAVRAVRVQLDGFLISLDRSRGKLRHLLIPHFLDRHFVNERGAKQIPRLRILRIQFGGLLQRF